MGHRLDIKRIIQSNFVRDLPMVVLGCAIAAFATDMFMIPNGLAAGGVTRRGDDYPRAGRSQWPDASRWHADHCDQCRAAAGGARAGGLALRYSNRDGLFLLVCSPTSLRLLSRRLAARN